MTQPNDPKVKTWDEWMPGLSVEMAHAEFRKLPRNAAYKYEYIDGAAILSPRPKRFHAVLSLADHRATAPGASNEEVRIRPTEPGDQEHFPRLFAASFRGVQPFGSLSDEERLQAARESLEKTQEGRDGKLLESACFTAIDAKKTTPLGGIVVTQVIGGDPSDYDSYAWPEHPVPFEKGQPHLTWIFVSPMRTGAGIGSRLLDAAVTVLSAMGYQELWSTFLLGNDSSMLWHWRNGFRLAPYEFSKRGRLPANPAADFP